MSEHPVMTTNPLRKLLVAAYVLLITLVVLEAAIRIWGYSEPHIYDPIYTSFDRTGDIPYIHKPNLMEARARGLAVINADSLGLRAKTAGATYGIKRSTEYCIAIVGDSCTFGEGVTRTKDTFAQVLEDTLNQRQQAVAVKVLNFGASAYSVKQMAATLQCRMVDIEPDLVILAVIPQDLNLSRTPIIDSAGYLVDRRLSFLIDSHVRDILRRVHLLYVLRDLVLLWVPVLQGSALPLSSGELPESYRYLYQFKEVAEQRGLPYMIVLIPMRTNAGGHFPPV